MTFPRPSAFPKACLGFLVAACTLAAQAEVKVEDAWVRATVPAQRSTGAFLTITSSRDAKLVGAASPVAKIVEIHESFHKDGVMRMEARPSIDLPAGKAVRLKPGGLHVMLMGLAKPVAAGDPVPLSLMVEEGGRRSTIEVRAVARPIGSR